MDPSLQYTDCWNHTYPTDAEVTGTENEVATPVVPMAMMVLGMCVSFLFLAVLRTMVMFLQVEQ